MYDTTYFVQQLLKNNWAEDGKVGKASDICAAVTDTI